MRKRASALCVVCLSIAGSVWLATYAYREHCEYRERQAVGRAQRALLNQMKVADSIGMRIKEFPDAEDLADIVLTPESEGWEYTTRSYRGPRNGDLKVLYYGLDSRPPREHVATFFMVYTLNGEITDIEEVSPLY